MRDALWVAAFFIESREGLGSHSKVSNEMAWRMLQKSVTKWGRDVTLMRLPPCRPLIKFSDVYLMRERFARREVCWVISFVHFIWLSQSSNSQRHRDCLKNANNEKRFFKRLYYFELKHSALLRMILFSNILEYLLYTKLLPQNWCFLFISKVYLRVCQNINLNYVITLKHMIRYSILYSLISFSLLLSSICSIQ